MLGAAVRIGGTTRFLVIIGDPIAQVRSPAAFNTRLAESGDNRFMIPWHAPVAAFERVMAGLMGTANVDGIVVTYPFKERALAFADIVMPRAAQVSAVNAIRREADGRWTADMFDGLGLVRAVASLGQSVRDRSVIVLGAGGAGSAIAFALADAGASKISIYDIDTAKATVLASKLNAILPDARAAARGPELGGIDLLINATPVGLAANDPLPVQLSDLTHETTVIDIVIREGGTRLLNHARSLGCPNVDGAAMVDGQTAAILEFFRISTGPQTPAHY